MSLCISADSPALPRSDGWKHKLPPPLLRQRLTAKTLAVRSCCAALCWPHCQKCWVARMSLCISADSPALPRSESWKHKLPPPLLRLRRGFLSAQLSCSRRESWDQTSGCTLPLGPCMHNKHAHQLGR